jgi:hypothetical protein
MQAHIVLSPSANLGMTVSNTYAVGFPAISTDVMTGIINIELADVRMRFDGTDPTTSGVDGATLMMKNGIWQVTGRDILTRMKFIAPTDPAFITLMCLKGE